MPLAEPTTLPARLRYAFALLRHMPRSVFRSVLALALCAVSLVIDSRRRRRPVLRSQTQTRTRRRT